MDTQAKLEILSEDSQYDLACACGSSRSEHRKRGAPGRWLYPVTLPQGGRSILLKTLISNSCVNDCKYCPLRAGSNVRRCSIPPEDLANVFMDYLKRLGIHGLFLSSGVTGTPDSGMERLIDTAAILRSRHKFKGYIHLKILPGASDAAVEEAVRLSSAVSLNIEVPGRRHFQKLSSSKDFDKDIVRPLKLMSQLAESAPKGHKVKCTTQFIVGASDESDAEIIKYMNGIYERLHFQRVYFSAYQPGLGDPSLPGEEKFSLSGSAPSDATLNREHRLYQVDFLMRKYGFDEKEIPLDSRGFLSLEKDPKLTWAEAHPEFFPVSLRKGSKEELLRIPGLGPASVSRLIASRLAGGVPSLFAVGVRGRRLRLASAYSIP